MFCEFATGAHASNDSANKNVDILLFIVYCVLFVISVKASLDQQ